MAAPFGAAANVGPAVNTPSTVVAKAIIAAGPGSSFDHVSHSFVVVRAWAPAARPGLEELAIDRSTSERHQALGLDRARPPALDDTLGTALNAFDMIFEGRLSAARR